MSRIVLCFLSLISTVYAANVLVLTGPRGSHQYLSLQVADKLVDFGHDVTVLTAFSDPRKDMSRARFRFAAFLDHVDKGGKDYFQKWDRKLHHITTLPTEDMVVDVVLQLEDQFISYNTHAMEYFLSSEFDQILKDGNFDLIVCEQFDHISSAPKLIDVDIPILGLFPIPTLAPTRTWNRFPSLINSEPNTMNTISATSQPSGLAERFKAVFRDIKISLHMYPIISNLYKDEMKRTGRTVGDYYFSFFDIILVYDHPAFSFAHLPAPNAFYLAPYNLVDRLVEPLPQTYMDFFDNCPFEHVIYLSFGTYFQNITGSPLSEVVVKALAGLEICVVLKTEVDIAGLSPAKFLQQKWVPQRDLLASGRVHYFLSHCGNNGRVESIFYNIPLLCLPLFGDQFLNARLVKGKEFGVMVTREEVSAPVLARAHQEMLGRREEFAENMKKATEIATSDPGAGIHALRYYSDLLIKHGNAEFLNNRLITKQWLYEVHNADIILFVGLGFIVAFALNLMVIVQILRCFLKTIKGSKSKRE